MPLKTGKWGLWEVRLLDGHQLWGKGRLSGCHVFCASSQAGRATLSHCSLYQQRRWQRLLWCGGRRQVQRHGPVLGAPAPGGRLPHLPGEWPAWLCRPGQPGGWNHLYSLGNAFLQKPRSAQLHTLAYYWGLGLGYKMDRVTETLAPECPGDQASVVCGLGLAFRSLPAPGR